MDKINILHIEDEPMFSEGITAKLGERFAVTLAVGDAQIHACLRDMAFDLILLDVDLGESRNALEMMDLLQASQVPIVVLSNRATDADKRALTYLGARGFIPKNYSIATLEDAIRVVLAGHTHFPAGFLRAITAKTGNELPHMTGQQLNVLTHLVRDPGKRTVDIGSAMGVKGAWVQNLVSQLMHSFRVHSRADLVEEARRRGFMPQKARFDVAA